MALDRPTRASETAEAVTARAAAEPVALGSAAHGVPERTSPPPPEFSDSASRGQVMTTARRLATLPWLLIGLAVFAVPLRRASLMLLAAAAALLVFTLGIPWVAHAQTPANESATGEPVILASAEGAPYLFADTSRIGDGNGIPFTPATGEGSNIEFTYSYQWVRVDGDDNETNVGEGKARYRLVDADTGHLIKVEVSFTDLDNYSETLTSLPFGPVARADPLASPATLVGNTGQTASATAVIDKQYAQEFTLGDHGQGYEISSVSVELAAVPSDLTVSLWIGNHSDRSSSPQTKLFDFANPASLRVGLNEFTAPAGVLLYHRVDYYIVLTGFGASLSIRETTSDAEDEGGEPGAQLRDSACERALDKTGRWESDCQRAGVLRLAVEGSRRASGILVSTYGQPFEGGQEIISIGDDCCFRMAAGPADRYLVRGFSWNSDDTTSRNGGISNPWDLRDGTTSTAASLFKLVNTRNAAGITEWTAPAGATVPGGSGKEYALGVDWDFPYHLSDGTRTGAALTRTWSTATGNTGRDRPRAPGVKLLQHGDVALIQPIAAVLGEPLYALAQNLGQADNSYALADSANPVLSQGFTTGPEDGGYGLLGIGVNIEGSESSGVAQLPDSPMSVAVAVYGADADGKPDAKLFDLVSPAEFAAGHSFFEAPAGTRLDASGDYVVVWQHNSGAGHRLQRTLGDNEDASEFAGFSIANAFFRGADLGNLSVNSGGNALEIVVYTNSPPRNATGRPAVLASAEGAPYLFADTSELGDAEGLPFTGTRSGHIEFTYSYRWIRVDGNTETGVETEVGTGSPTYRLVDADTGKLIQVEVSFRDRVGNPEAVTSLPYGPVLRPAALPSPTTLVGNTGQTPSATAVITGQYNMGFRLGSHGQGYELSSVEIDLAAVPSSLGVSLWIGDHAIQSSGRRGKLYDFENPGSFKVGLNRFTAPAGVLLYQQVDYFIVLSEFGASLSIRETTSDAEDEGGEAGAILFNNAGGDTGVLRLAVEGSRRASGILGSTYTQPAAGDQEVISAGDDCCFEMGVGLADRYLVRGFSWRSDDTTARAGGVTNPWHLLDGTSAKAARLFKLVNTRNAAGIPEWTAPQGATVAGGSRYTFELDWEFHKDSVAAASRTGGALSRMFSTTSAGPDRPFSPGVSFSSHGDIAVPAKGAALLAVLGEPLYALVQNLGQADNGYALADSANPVLSQGFTTGPEDGGYGLQGIGVNIEGSESSGVAQLPDSPMSVAVAVYSAGADGKPDTKLFDLVSPAEFAAGHSFFEAPAGTRLDAGADYVVVWQHSSGAGHRLQRTLGDNEDASEFAGFSVANAFFRGADLGNLSVNSGGNALEIVVYTNSPPRNATGRPSVLASAEGAPYLFADTSELGDADGLPFTGTLSGHIEFTYSYRWIRVDGNTETGVETEVGTGSPTYRLVDADTGKLIQVEVSFRDRVGNPEAVTSLPYGPVLRADPLPSPTTLVGNTGQTPSATAVITGQYNMGFRLGSHGQGYELSSVAIDLAAVPSSLGVSLWIGDHAIQSSGRRGKLYDFENPGSFKVGLNRFTAPAGVLLYQQVDYFIVLSGFGSSLSIRETTSDAEDEGGEAGAILFNNAGGDTGVLRLAVEGSRRASGILGSTYTQPAAGDQEVISAGDDCCFEMGVGLADRYLVRGFSWRSDDTTARAGGVTNPWHLLDGTSAKAARLFKLVNTRNAAGIPEWTAPQGATVAGGSRYTFELDWEFHKDSVAAASRTGGALSRMFSTTSAGPDRPFSPGVSFSSHGDIAVPAKGAALLAVLGEPLYALVQNLGQADNGYVQLGDTSARVVTQGFETGSESGGYGLQGIGVNIEGSDDANGFAQVPEDATSVSVSVHAFDTGGTPGAKLFDLVSPTEFAPGHSFFEAPAGTRLAGSTPYILVWTYNAGSWHRLRQTTSDNEDAGAFGGASIANAFFLGPDTLDLATDTDGNSLEIAVYTDTTPRNASGLPVALVSAEGGSVLAADTSRIADADGLPHIGAPDSGIEGYAFSYQWFRVDTDPETETGTGTMTMTMTEVGADSQRYQLVNADVGKLVQVRVSFVDRAGFPEALTSLPFGPVPRRELSAAPTTLVGNTGQAPSATVDISGQYAVGFRLGTHGQGYEISSVEIDLAAVPSSLSVSLWTEGAPGSDYAGSPVAKLFDFENPSSFQVGLNRFKAPAGAFAYQNLNYFIVLSGFGDSLSINETTSDAEDEGGEPGASLSNDAGGDTGVLRLAVEGAQRTGGILAANYAQSIVGDQEVISLGDTIVFGIVVGAADRYLIRGVTFASDDTTSRGAGFTNPFWLRSDSLTGDRQFDLVNTRDVGGQGVWTAPQGATVPGGCTTTMEMMVEVVTCNQYVFDWADINVKKQNDVDRIGAVLSRFLQVADEADGQADPPTAPGVSLRTGGFTDDSDYGGNTPVMAVHGEALVAMVQNLGQTDNGYVEVGGASAKVLTQGFTTGSDALYRLQGVGVNIEGSVNTDGDAQAPDDSASVAVSVHASGVGGTPDAKLFDLVSPTEYAPGHSFFEAPPGTFLFPNTAYVLVWRHRGGTLHRLQQTSGDGEDTGAATDASIADVFWLGSQTGDSLSLNRDTDGNVLELAVYTEVFETAPFVAEDIIEVPLGWLHMPEGVGMGYQFRALFVTHRGRLPTSADIEDYNDFVQWEAAQSYSDPVVRSAASEFGAVACTALVDARTNTGMAGPIGVPVHWLDGGWEDRPTLVARLNGAFYGSEWANTGYGAYVTGNSAHFHPSARVWTGCDAFGGPHPTLPMGANTPMHLVAVGTPNDAGSDNNAPLGAVDVDSGFVAHSYYVVIDGEGQERLLPLYAISPVFTVVAGPEGG